MGASFPESVQGQAEWVPVQPDLVIGNAAIQEDWNWMIFEVTPSRSHSVIVLSLV